MLMEKFQVSERRACKVIDLHRATRRYEVKEDQINKTVTPRIIHYASEHGRYGYKRITALVRTEGRRTNNKQEMSYYETRLRELKKDKAIEAQKPNLGSITSDWRTHPCCMKLSSALIRPSQNTSFRSWVRKSFGRNISSRSLKRPQKSARP